MTTTLQDMAAKKNARPEPSAEQRAAVELVRSAKEQALSLTSPDGLLTQLTKTMLETDEVRRLRRVRARRHTAPRASALASARSAVAVCWQSSGR